MPAPTEITLCSKDQVKQFIKIGVGFDRYDEIIQAAILTASQQVLQYIGRDLRVGTKVQYAASPTGASGYPARIKLTGDEINYNLPIVVKYDATGRFGDNAVVLTAGYDYEIDRSEGIVWLLNSFGYAPRGIRIEYSAGYEFAADPPTLLQVPASIANATAMQAGFLYNRIQGGQLGMSSSENDNTTKTVWTRAATTGLLGEVKAMLGVKGRTPFVSRF